ncbi:MAG: MmcQ/YjbR family DNA-binding protein [Candidatus Saccharibacteria bacterium]|nr:MmcQ/YjbR family DNA-binding protein [Candidatus Saccharibacteria bacterium]
MDQQFEQKIDHYIMQLGEIVIDDQRLKDHRLYRLNKQIENPDQLIFAIVKQGSFPVMLDLLCDRKLANNLREKYESVVPSKIMDETSWNRIICSGQLSEQEVFDLINLAYQLAIKNNPN